MSQRRRKALVGLFVATGCAILVLALLSAGTLKSLLGRTVSLQTQFKTVDGLKAGDSVWYAGVPVGTVDDVSLGESAVWVDLSIRGRAADDIPGSVAAKLASDGLLGNRIVTLQDNGPAGGPPIQDGQRIESETHVSSEQIMEDFTVMNEELLVVVRDLRTVTDAVAQGEGTLGKLVHDDQLYEDLSATADNADRMTASAARFAARLDDEDNVVNRLMTDEALYDSIQSSVAEIEETSQDASAVVARLDRATSDRNTPVGVMLHDRGAGEDLESTFDNLEEGSELLAENLEALQHNFLLRGFFKKKQKREQEEADRRETRVTSMELVDETL